MEHQHSRILAEVRRGFASDVLPELAGSETYDLIHLDAAARIEQSSNVAQYRCWTRTAQGMKSYMQFLDLALGRLMASSPHFLGGSSSCFGAARHSKVLVTASMVNYSIKKGEGP